MTKLYLNKFWGDNNNYLYGDGGVEQDNKHDKNYKSIIDEKDMDKDVSDEY